MSVWSFLYEPFKIKDVVAQETASPDKPVESGYIKPFLSGTADIIGSTVGTAAASTIKPLFLYLVVFLIVGIFALNISKKVV